MRENKPRHKCLKQSITLREMEQIWRGAKIGRLRKKLVIEWRPDKGEPHVSYQVFIYLVVNKEPLKGFNQEQT